MPTSTFSAEIRYTREPENDDNRSRAGTEWEQIPTSSPNGTAVWPVPGRMVLRKQMARWWIEITARKWIIGSGDGSTG